MKIGTRGIRRRIDPRHLRLALAPLSLAALTAASPSRAEIGPLPEGGGWFRCTPASNVSLTRTLPRNVPAVPLNPSSLAGGAAFQLVGGSATIAAEARSEYWNGFAMWLVVPSAEPSAGDYQLRYDEECDKTDAGDYGRRFHTVDLPFRFTNEARLPTATGDLIATQVLSDEPPYISQDFPPNGGVCVYNAYRWVKVSVHWSMASEIGAFGEAVQAVGYRPNGTDGYRRNYGTSDPSGPQAEVFNELVNCNQWQSSAAGFVNGRGTYRLRSHLAGAAQDLPELAAEIQLACPPPEIVGICYDGGADAPPDAPDPTVPDAPASDAPAPDAPFDAGTIPDGSPRHDAPEAGRFDGPSGPSLDAPGVGSLDASRNADARKEASQDGSSGPIDAPPPQADGAATPSDEPPDDGVGRGCSVSKLGETRPKTGNTGLLGALMLVGAAIRRRYAPRKQN